MRRWIVALVLVIAVPGGALAQLPGAVGVCSKSSAVTPVRGDEGNPAAVIVSALKSADQVVVCMSGSSEESPGHGIFGLVTWKKRAGVAMQLHRLPDRSYLITDIVQFNSLKAPLGSWHADQDSVVWQPRRVVEDLEDGLTELSMQFLGENDLADVDILSKVPQTWR